MDLLHAVGRADLSAYVDFGALRQAAASSGGAVACYGPVEQRQLLWALGLDARLQAQNRN